MNPSINVNSPFVPDVGGVLSGLAGLAKNPFESEHSPFASDAQMGDVEGKNTVEAQTTFSGPFGPQVEGEDAPDFSEYTPTPFDPNLDMGSTLTDVEKRYKAILEGDDPIAAQNERLGLTALSQMGANVEQQTARQAAELGIPVGSRQYNELLERNRASLVTGGSGLMSKIASQNMASQRKVLSEMGTLGKFKATHGLSVAKFEDSIKRYGYEAAMNKIDDKNRMIEFVMKNPDSFSIATQDAVRRDFFGQMGIDTTNLPSDPTEAEQTLTTIKEWLTTAHPDWTEEQINTEALGRLTKLSPYTNELYGKAYDEAVGASGPPPASGDDPVLTGEDEGGTEAGAIDDTGIMDNFTIQELLEANPLTGGGYERPGPMSPPTVPYPYPGEEPFPPFTTLP